MPHIAEALRELQAISSFVIPLGSYPDGEHRTIAFH